MKNRQRPPVIVIAGPTAAGKSALALRLAQALGGVVINADSMQVYRDLRILTARPSEADEEAVPHRLYGYVDAGRRYSAIRWRADAVEAIEAVYASGKVPIVAGGTGFYIEALTQGLSPMPDVPEDVLLALAARAEADGLEQVYQAVQACDPALAERVGPTDRQRLVRALAVYEATGKPLSAWQMLPPEPPPFGSVGFWLNPPREWLYARCNARLAAMVGEGALEEVAALVDRGLEPSLPAMKALGVAELAAAARGDIAAEEALAAAQQATRRFAKRQLTWFRNRFDRFNRIDSQFSESLAEKIITKIQNNG
jgi:tRNA dimethylallyltransferase